MGRPDMNDSGGPRESADVLAPDERFAAAAPAPVRFDPFPAHPPRSAYVHIPFCIHKCGYCDFASVAGEDDVIRNTINDNSDDLEKIASELIRQSNESGGNDNISAILARPGKAVAAGNGLFSRFFGLSS